MKKIYVYLRHCYYSKIQESPGKQRPFWWDKEKVFENFKSTLNSDTTNYSIVYDEYYGKIKDTFLSTETNAHIINEGGEAKSFLKTLQYIQTQNHSPEDIIYFLEDDYVHRPNWDKILLEAFTLPVSYVTLYDHNDKYGEYYSEFRTKVFHTESSHWMATPSTTNTFATKYSTLLEDIKIHTKYSTGVEPSADHYKFLELSQNGRVLISSLPGYSTHCQEHLLSPCIDWEKYL
jgi:hypothetical protein